MGPMARAARRRVAQGRGTASSTRCTGGYLCSPSATKRAPQLGAPPPLASAGGSVLARLPKRHGAKISIAEPAPALVVGEVFVPIRAAFRALRRCSAVMRESGFFPFLPPSKAKFRCLAFSTQPRLGPRGAVALQAGWGRQRRAGSHWQRYSALCRGATRVRSWWSFQKYGSGKGRESSSALAPRL